MSFEEILKNKDNLQGLPKSYLIRVIVYLVKLVLKQKKKLGDDDPSPTTPPSQIPPYKKPSKKKKKKKNKNGRRNGHKGTTRNKNIDVTHTCDSKPEGKCSCGGELGESHPTTKKVVEDIEEVKKTVTEVTIYSSECNVCGSVYEGITPNVLKNNTIGNNILVWGIYLHFFIGVSFRNVVSIFNKLLNFDVSAGCLSQNWNKIADILEVAYDKLIPYLEKPGYAHSDETGWRVSGSTWWAWVFTNRECCIYFITNSRGSAVPRKFFSDFFNGVLISDFFSAYGLINSLLKQKCFSHIFTEIKKCLKIDESESLKCFCKKLKRILHDAMKLKLDFENSRITKKEFGSKLKLLEKRLDLLIKSPVGNENKNAKRLRKRLRKFRDEIFTFLYIDGIEATNNIAERRVRPIALMRKVSFGSYSSRGVKTRYILMSLIQTCKILEIDFIAYAKFALNEHIYGREVPGIHEYSSLIATENEIIAA